MAGIIQKLRCTPFIARVVPFVIFAALTTLQGQFGPEAKYWIYLGKTLVGVWLLWAVWPVVAEMRWKVSWEAVVVGIGVYVLWVGLDPFYPKWISTDDPWNPFLQYGPGIAWLIIIGRILGSTLVVPPLEEMFYRSFVYRYIIKPDFDSVPLNRWHPGAFFVTSIIFGVVHREWLAGIFCGMAYQWLVLRKNRLGEAMTAHAITNFLLGCHVAYKGPWQFW